MRYWALYSGGKDSSSIVSWLQERGLLAGVISINTGISAPDWMPFVEKTANERRWDLNIIPTNYDYDRLVLKYGFPGASAHGMFMNYLKGRAIRQFKKKYPGEILASGVRSNESRRRFKNTKEWGFFEGVRVWAPIYNWTTEQTWEFFRKSGFERSPCYQTLCISGDCLCGAFATSFERGMIQAAYPDIHERLSYLEKKVDHSWGWSNNKDAKKRKRSPVCVDCEAPQLEFSL